MRIHELEEEIAGYNVNKNAPFTPETNEVKEFKSSKYFTVVSNKVSIKYGGETKFLDRFLKAREFNHKAASNMITEALRFREENKLDETSTNKRREELFERFSEYYPVNFWGFSRLGNLVVFGKLGNLKTGVIQKKFSPEEILEYFLQYNEKVIYYQSFGNATIRPDDDHVWKGSIEVYDLEGLTLSQVLKNLHAAKLLGSVLSKCSDIYPETLEKTVLLNVPGFFKMLWDVLSKFLSKHTLSKVEVLSKSQNSRARELLSNYLTPADVTEILAEHPQTPAVPSTPE